MGCGEGEGHNRRNDAVGLGEPTFGGILFYYSAHIEKLQLFTDNIRK